MKMKILQFLLCVLLVESMKRKNDNRNENRKLKRRAEALLKKELKKGRAEYAKLQRIRERKSASRTNKMRKSIKERYVISLLENAYKIC